MTINMQTRANPVPIPSIIPHPSRAKTPNRPRTPKGTRTPPTYPFPAYAIVKEQNDGTKFPVAKRSRLASHQTLFKTPPVFGGASVYSFTQSPSTPRAEV